MITLAALVFLLGASPTPAAPPDPPAPPAVQAPPAFDDPSFPFGGDEGETSLRRVREQVAVGSDVHVERDQLVEGDVVCVGGAVRIDGVVRGDVVVVGGRLDVSGTVHQQVVAVGSRVRIDDAARVRGQLVTVLGKLDRDKARVDGEVTNLSFGGLFVPTGVGIAGLAFAAIAWDALVLLATAFAVLALAALAPERIERIAAAGPRSPFAAVGGGILGYVLVAIVLGVLVITILGIPVAILLWCAFTLLKWMGLAGLSLAIGRRLARGFGKSLPLAAAVLLGFLPLAILRLVPFGVGWALWFLVEIFAVGCVIASRAGRAAPESIPAPV
ncbi:MAG TPA: hypothetical protein VF139_04105 [Candidatus Polarisedimenticolaceae bacterium]